MQNAGQRLANALHPSLRLTLASWLTEHRERNCNEGAIICRCECPDHGCREIADGPADVCQGCRGVGWVSVNGRAVPCPICVPKAARRDMQRRRLATGISPRMWERYTLDALKPGSPARVGADAYINKGFNPAFVTFYGKPGTGKTHAAVAIAAEAVDRGLTVQFWRLADLLDYLRSALDSDSESMAAHMHGPKTCGLLILDDLGAERETGWTAERVLTIVDHRHSNELPTVITTNLDPAELSVDRLYSRVFGEADAFVVPTGGTDGRQKGR